MPPEAETETEQKPAAEAPPEKTLTQSEVNAILARERSSLERKFNERIAALEPKAKLAEELEAKAREAEEAKLSAAQRQELDRKREREAYEKKIADSDASARMEKEKRHALLVQVEASMRMNAVAPKLFNPSLAKAAMREVTDRLRVEVDAEGEERVVAVMGSEQDREPLATAWEKIERDHLSPFFKAAGGAGAAHGGGGGAGGRSAFAGMSPTEKIAATLKGR